MTSRPASKRTPAELRLLAQATAYRSWAHTDDPSARTAPARRAAREGRRTRFANEIDPERKLPPAELERRIDLAIKADMLKLAAASVQARRIRRELAAERAARGRGRAS
jgi:hypothetical protein